MGFNWFSTHKDSCVKERVIYVDRETRTDVNPNPNNFVILKTKQVGKNLVVKIKYPNATNFEGVKILVFHKMTEKKLAAMNSIDPHFYEKSSLIARLIPTNAGWDMAILIATNVR